jgi:hypothetical protein
MEQKIARICSSASGPDCDCCPCNLPHTDTYFCEGKPCTEKAYCTLIGAYVQCIPMHGDSYKECTCEENDVENI